MITVERQDDECMLVKFEQQEDLGGAVEILMGQLPKYGDPVSLLYLPAGIPNGDIFSQPGYIGIKKP